MKQLSIMIIITVTFWWACCMIKDKFILTIQWVFLVQTLFRINIQRSIPELQLKPIKKTIWTDHSTDQRSNSFERNVNNEVDYLMPKNVFVSKIIFSVWYLILYYPEESFPLHILSAKSDIFKQHTICSQSSTFMPNMHNVYAISKHRTLCIQLQLPTMNWFDVDCCMMIQTKNP